MTKSSKKSLPVKSSYLFDPIKRSSGPGPEWSDEQLLEILANTINALRRRASSDLLEIGYRLIEANLIAGHGNWLSWLDHNFGWTEQTALNYMRLYELNKSKTVLDLDLPLKALYQLAAPSTPLEAIDAVIGRAEAGEKLSVAEVKRVVCETKAAKPNKDQVMKKTPQKGKTAQPNDDDDLGEAIYNLEHLCKKYGHDGLKEVVAVLIEQHGYDAVSDAVLHHNP